MQVTRGIHSLNPKEFPPSPDWVKPLPETNISLELVEGRKVYEFPGDDFLEYYVKEVGFQPPKDFVKRVLTGGEFSFFWLGPGEMPDKTSLPIGFLRKNERGTIVNTLGGDENLHIGRKVTLGDLPRVVEAEFLARISQMNVAHRAHQSIEFPLFADIRALEEFEYPLANLYADSLWELGACFSENFQFKRTHWFGDDFPEEKYPVMILIFEERQAAKELKAQIKSLAKRDSQLKDVSNELGKKHSKRGFALVSLSEDPFYLDRIMSRLILSYKP